MFLANNLYQLDAETENTGSFGVNKKKTKESQVTSGAR